MIIAVCVDNQMGLQFNKRRQSKDSLLRQRLWELSGGALRMSAYSAKQFSEAVYAGEDYLHAAGDGQWCFCEDAEYLNYADSIEKIVLFKWNRDYPADLHFTFPGQWTLETTEDFCGSSHDRITQEVYVQ